jgi:hypothetical protein
MSHQTFAPFKSKQGISRDCSVVDLKYCVPAISGSYDKEAELMMTEIDEGDRKRS